MNEDEPTEVILRQGQVHDFLNKDELKSKIPILKKGYGLLQIVRKATGVYYLRFKEFEAVNRYDESIYVYLRREMFDMKSSVNEASFYTTFDTTHEKVSLDNSLSGQLKGIQLKGNFEQRLNCFDALDYASILIAKPAAAKPPTPLPKIHLFANMEIYVENDDEKTKRLEERREALEKEMTEMGTNAASDLRKVQFTVLDIREKASEVFQMFDRDKSGTIDFMEFKQMIAYRGISLLDPQAKRFFCLCDEDNGGEIDQDEFEMALYITNYLQSRPDSTRLIPADAFALFDENRDGLINIYEFQHAMALLKIPKNTPPRILHQVFHRLDVRQQLHLDADQFCQAYLRLVDAEAELKSRGHIPERGGFLKKGAKLRNQNRLAELISAQMQQEIAASEEAKAVVAEMQQQARMEGTEANRSIQHTKQTEEMQMRTAMGLAARAEKIERRRERFRIMKLEREETRQRNKVERETKERDELYREAKTESMKREMSDVITRRADRYQDILVLTHQNLSEIPKYLYSGKEALLQLSLFLSISLRNNNILKIPANFVYNLDALQKLDLSHNKVDCLPPEVVHLFELRTLSLQHNHLSILPNNINRLQKLEYLDISFNHLKTLPNMSSMVGLLTLKCVENYIEQLPTEMGRLENLQTLILRGNALENLPDGFGKTMHALVNLDLSSNHLRRLGQHFGGMLSLRNLNVSYNDLRQIPNILHTLPSLQSFDISHNALISLPESIGTLKQCMELILDHNKLRMLPPDMGNMISLEWLSLQKNDLQHVPNTLGNCRCLKFLNLRNNRLVELPLELGSLHQLITLDVAFNELTGIPDELGFMVSLTACNFQANLLSSLTPCLNQMQFLQELNVQNNQLADAEHINTVIHFLAELTSLNLSHNLLIAFPDSCCSLPHLKHLNLAANQIQRIPSNIQYMKSLTELDVYNNRLQTLPHELCCIVSQLSKLHVENNPFSQLVLNTVHYPTRFLHQQSPQLIPHQTIPISDTIVRNWLLDQSIYYTTLQDVWQKHGKERFLDRQSPADVHSFIALMREGLQDRWEARLETTLKQWFWYLKKVGFLEGHDNNETKLWQSKRQEQTKTLLEKEAVRVESVHARYHVEAAELAFLSSSNQIAHQVRLATERTRTSRTMQTQIKTISVVHENRGQALRAARRRHFAQEMQKEMQVRSDLRSQSRDAKQEEDRWELYRRTGYLDSED